MSDETLRALRGRVKAVLKQRLTNLLDTSTATGVLSDDEHRTIYALFQVIADDREFPAAELKTFVNRRTEETPGVLDAYRRSVILLDSATWKTKEFAKRRFATLTFEERDRVLHALFRPFPHEERAPLWLRDARLPPYRLSLLLETGSRRVLRHHVMRELLTWYFTTERGWAVVGWTDFPGKARPE